MTRRLFHEDPYLKKFSGRVIEHLRVADRPAVVLDQTAFYATSGGQPFDTGTLGTCRVVDVLEEEDGRIVHVLDGECPRGAIDGEIDWERRFDHMQHHTGQHILSQAFVRTAEAPTVSFHLGARTSTIDIELAGPTTEIMSTAEALANRIVFEDRPVNLLRVSPEELAELGVRKMSDRLGEVRVIDVEGFDRSPCGGTHVKRTGEIGIISILGFERYKGGTRVEFVCGGRALATLRRDHDTLKSLGKIFSADIYDLPVLSEKLIQERGAAERESTKLRGEILAYEAAALREESRSVDGMLLVRRRFSGRSIDELKILAQKITASERAAALLATVGDGAQIVVARSSDLKGDCGKVVKETAARQGGRGGGKPEIAQAGGVDGGAVDAWLDEAEALLRAHLRSE